MSVEKKLIIWEKEGLISFDQRQKILAYEKSTVFFASKALLPLIGAFSVGLGIISLIAFNWHAIPDTVKWMGMFFLLTSTAIFCAVYQSKKTVLFETGLLVFSLLLLGTIGLTAQIFHLKGDSWQTLLFWGMLMLPVTAISVLKLMPFLSGTVFVFAFLSSPLGADALKFFFSDKCLWPAFLLGGISFTCYEFLKIWREKYPRLTSFLAFYLPFVFFSVLFIAYEYRFSPLMTLLQVCLLIAMAFRFTKTGNDRLFTLASLLAGVRLLQFFIITFHSLLATGIGLILFGLVLWTVFFLRKKLKIKGGNHV